MTARTIRKKENRPLFAIMVQGTASNAGKSVIATALCRILYQEGYRVAPFKAQNMALNSYPTRDGGEIGRAQVVQAEAAEVEPTVDMNPILLKPCSDKGCQVIIHGKVYRNMTAQEYYAFKEQAFTFVRDSYRRLAQAFEIIVIEGAGSPAEINLRDWDIANMRIAEMANSPVLLVADIDRGGVFASIVGTMELLSEKERERIKGYIINKFRGDMDLLSPGLSFLGERTGLPVLGVIPYFREISIPGEDSVCLEDGRGEHGTERVSIRIGVIRLPHISNYTDFDSLVQEPGVRVRYLVKAEEVYNTDVVVIPGSKNTIGDLIYLKKEGFEKAILRHHKKGGTIVGICGGFQMLGLRVEDPWGMESDFREVQGMGLLNAVTTLEQEKATFQVEAVPVSGRPYGEGWRLEGYEIHLGRTILGEGPAPFLKVFRRDGKGTVVLDGAISSDGKVWGTYIHGIFDHPGFRRSFLNTIREQKGLPPLDSPLTFNGRDFRRRQYDELARLVRNSLEMERVFQIMGLVPGQESVVSNQELTSDL